MFFNFSWVFVTICHIQYSKTNMMHFLFSLLRMNGLYMIHALYAHLQEAPHKRHLVCCVRAVSFGCTRNGIQPTDITRTQYTKYRLCSPS
jgi:hypothetical protein